MTTNIDVTIQALFTKLDERKKKVAALEAEIGKSWKTNGSFVGSGGIAAINIQTATAETIENCATQLCLIEGARQEAGELLGRTITTKHGGYSKEDWVSDFKKRLATIDVREEKKQLEALENRLNGVLSPEERRRIEVELLAKALEG